MQKCGLGKKFYKKIKNNRIWPSLFTPLPGWPCGADFHTFWHAGLYGRCNYACQILSRLVKGLGGYGSPKSGVSQWLWMSLLQQCYALTCYTVIQILSGVGKGCGIVQGVAGAIQCWRLLWCNLKLPQSSFFISASLISAVRQPIG